jgi:hypothetical protein
MTIAFVSVAARPSKTDGGSDYAAVATGDPATVRTMSPVNAT